MTKMKFKDDLNTLVSDMITDAKAALQIEDATFQESEVAYNDALEAAKKPAKEDESKVALAEDEEEIDVLEAKVLSTEEVDVLEAKVLSTTKDLNPLYVFEKRLTQAIADFGKTDGEEKDVAAFKRAFNLAQAECVNRYKAEDNSTAVDYLKAAGLMLLGALVAIIASPVLLFSADKRQDLGNFFFSGVDTDKSKLAQEQMKAGAADSLLEEVSEVALDSNM